MKISQILLGAALTEWGTSLTMVITTIDGFFIARGQLQKTIAMGPADIIDEITQFLSEHSEHPIYGKLKLAGTALTLEASIDSTCANTLEYFDVAAWKDYPIQSELSDLLGGVPTAIDTLVNGLLAEELAAESAKGAVPQCAALIDADQSIMLSLAYRGEILHAPQFGALGHMQVATEGAVCSCGGRGHLLTIASTGAMRQTIVRRMEQYPETTQRVDEITAGNAIAITPQQIWQLTQENDTVALNLLNDLTQALAYAVSFIIETYDTDRIFITGEYAKFGQDWLWLLNHRVAEFCQPKRAEHLNQIIKLGSVHADKYVRGALALAAANIAN